MFYWEYAVQVYDTNTNNIETCRGVLATKGSKPNLANAAAALDNHYGDTLIDVTKLYYVNDFDCYQFNSDDTSYTLTIDNNVS